MVEKQFNELVEQIERFLSLSHEIIYDKITVIQDQIQDLKNWMMFFSITIIIVILLALIITIIHFVKLENEIKICHRNNLILQQKILELCNKDNQSCDKNGE